MKKSRIEVPLPPCGMFIGSGVYPMSKDYLMSALYGHQSWMPQEFSPAEIIDKIVEDNQGNLAQLWNASRGYSPAMIAQWQYALDEIGVEVPPPDWGNLEHIKASESPILKEHADRNGAGLLRFVREAAKKDIYTMFIYTSAAEKWSQQFLDQGKHYLGYDFGERFTFNLGAILKKGVALEDVTLQMLADDFIARVKQHVDERHEAGWGNVYATSSNFCIDYEIAGGTDVPLVEDFAFAHLNFASALSRGLYRQFDLPTWGSHLAHEHYSWIPNASPHKWNLLRASMFQKYMSGCKVLINESGNWFVEASLVVDSPKFDFPRVPLQPADVKWGGDVPVKFAPYIEEARKHFHKIDYDSENPRRYRQEISDFYDFVKENGTPEGQPESTIAIAKGNLDLSHHRYVPNNAVGGAGQKAEKNAAWLYGAPERGWDIVKQVFFPRPNVIEPYENAFVSGTPFGQVDIVSFVGDEISAEFLSANYKALLFSGWNTSSDKQYATLKSYVENGGTLFISIPQLSTDDARSHNDYGTDKLVNQGDFSDLCGVKVLGRGKQIYWATAPEGSNDLGFEFPRRFGILWVHQGKIEITDPAVEVLAIDDEQAAPLVTRRKLGKGTVYFLNSWAYPGAFDQDYGPGSTRNSPGLVGMIYRHIAKQARGEVWMSDDGDEPGEQCEYISFSYFPEAGKICLYNIDFENPRSAVLHWQGKSERIELGAGEFRTLKVDASRSETYFPGVSKK